VTTETTTPATPVPVVTCDFRGRTMAIRIPNPERLAMFQQTLRSIKGMQGQKLDATRAIKFYDQSTRIILSILADDDDKEWLRDQFYDGDLELAEAFGIVESAMAAMNTTKAPTSGPVAKKSAARRTKK